VSHPESSIRSNSLTAKSASVSAGRFAKRSATTEAPFTKSSADIPRRV
jgi:hypothetical protein